MAVKVHEKGERAKRPVFVCFDGLRLRTFGWIVPTLEMTQLMPVATINVATFGELC
jgi:hypothetical protein